MNPLPDILEIQPLERPPNCAVTVPGSRSITNRALILAALANGKCTLRGALWADDAQVMVGALESLGFDVYVGPDRMDKCNRTIEIVGRGGEIPAKKAELYVASAGTAARFLSALVALGRGEYRIFGDVRMQKHPMDDVFEGLRSLGVTVESQHRNCLPAVIRSTGLRGGSVTVSARHSSQFARALLLISDVAGLKVQLSEPDEPYSGVNMTCRMAETFRHDYLIEPDLCSASCFIAAAFLTRGRVEVVGWPERSLQMDGRFPQFLPPPARVSRLRDLGDSVMTLSFCALFGKQSLRVEDADRMRWQECDRVQALVTELKRTGAEAVEFPDGLAVWPAKPGQLHGATIETYNDHRMVMCFAVLGLKVPGIRIKNPGCVGGTFPNFFEKLQLLRSETGGTPVLL